MIKLTNIIAVGLFIISAIVLIKMKPVYQIVINGEMVGYIQNKAKFEDTIYKFFNNNEEENIAFADFNFEIKNSLKLMDRKQETSEDKVLLAIKEKANITYFEYGVFVDGEEQLKLTSKDEANAIVENLKKEFGDKVYFEVKKVYLKNIETTNNESIQLASISNNIQTQINKKIEEEKKKEKSTINGVYIAVVPVEGHIT